MYIISNLIKKIYFNNYLIRGKIMHRKKSILFLILLMTFFLSNIIAARAAVYSLGVAENDEYIYKVTTVDQEGLEAVFGTNWASMMGEAAIEDAKIKYVITGISDKTTYWEVTFQFWDWTVGDFDEYPDDTTYYTYIYKDAVSFNGLIVPVPVDAYLTALVGTLPTYVDWITAEDTSLTFDYGKIPYYSYNYKEVFTFDEEKGVLTSNKYTYVGKTIWELKLQTFQIPGYELQILLGITAISTIGLIYIIRRKK